MLKTPIPPNASVTETRKPIPQTKEIEKGAHTISAVREQAQPGTLADFSVFFRLMITYRVPMMVDEAIIYRKTFEDNIYYCCPRCQRTLEREFLAYCDRCGQCLDWRDYRKARRTYFKPKR